MAGFPDSRLLTRWHGAAGVLGWADLALAVLRIVGVPARAGWPTSGECARAADGDRIPADRHSARRRVLAVVAGRPPVGAARVDPGIWGARPDRPGHQGIHGRRPGVGVRPYRG